MTRLHDPDPRPPLGVRPILDEMRTIARVRGLRNARVGYKINARGEHVVALIFEGFDAVTGPDPRDLR